VFDENCFIILIFISNIITGDETWVGGYDPQTKRQSLQWKSLNSPRQKKARQVRSIVKSMLIFFSISKALYLRTYVSYNYQHALRNNPEKWRSWRFRQGIQAKKIILRNNRHEELKNVGVY